MSEVFVGDFGTVIALDCGMNVSGSSVRKIIAKKPNGQVVEWVAALDGTNGIKYSIHPGDLDMAGVWLLQAYAEIDGWHGKGTVARLVVSRVLQ